MNTSTFINEISLVPLYLNVICSPFTRKLFRSDRFHRYTSINSTMNSFSAFLSPMIRVVEERDKHLTRPLERNWQDIAQYSQQTTQYYPVCAIYFQVFENHTIYCTTFQYCPHTINYIAQTKILHNNIERLGAALDGIKKMKRLLSNKQQQEEMGQR